MVRVGLQFNGFKVVINGQKIVGRAIMIVAVVQLIYLSVKH